MSAAFPFVLETGQITKVTTLVDKTSDLLSTINKILGL